MIKDLVDWVREAFEEQSRTFLDEQPEHMPSFITDSEIEWRMRNHGD